MNRARLFLLAVLSLTLASCASRPIKPPEYVPPKIDCAISDAPRQAAPAEPAPTARSVIIWQMYAWSWQAYALDVVMQRYDSAKCVQQLREQRVVR
ncbi:MAG: hypothetical protein NDI84_08295 [Steroidobacteraceae bacterium]|nr:hypothetical protein [Steroidobacteraceae bacterium]